MPPCDIYPNAGKATLSNDGWAITLDPYRVAYGGRDAYIDLGAEHASFDMVLGRIHKPI